MPFQNRRARDKSTDKSNDETDKPKVTSGTITLLQMQKRNKDRVNVFLDGEFAFALGLNAALGLKKGQQLSEADVEAFMHDGDVDLAFQRAVRYLGMRPRSSAEIVTYLKQKEYDETVVETVIQRLHEHSYLDDEAFARFWVDNRNRFRPKGGQALRYELRQKGVERDTIDATLEEQDEAGAAWAAAEPKIGRWADLEKFEFEQKVMTYLSRRGFRFDVCRNTAGLAWTQVQEEKE